MPLLSRRKHINISFSAYRMTLISNTLAFLESILCNMQLHEFSFGWNADRLMDKQIIWYLSYTLWASITYNQMKIWELICKTKYSTAYCELAYLRAESNVNSANFYPQITFICMEKKTHAIFTKIITILCPTSFRFVVSVRLLVR